MTIDLPAGHERLAIVGASERYLKLIRDHLGVHLFARNGKLKISGQGRSVNQAAHVIDLLSRAARRHQPMHHQQVVDAILASSNSATTTSPDEQNPGTQPPKDGLEVYSSSRRVRPMSPAQGRYLHAILNHDLVFCSGPAGTGKTYLAVAAAISLLKRGRTRKLVLARPAVEAGERLGFLPGDMQQKVNPFLRPLLDALHDMMEYEQVQRFLACDMIEIIPLAFMRGRTLNDAVVILDEAQNTTKQQMLMFLTRMGHGSKMIVTGDTTQIDLAQPTDSGLIDAVRRLQRVKGIEFITLGQSDIVRHNLVQRVVEAYAPRTKRPTGTPAQPDQDHTELPLADRTQPTPRSQTE